MSSRLLGVDIHEGMKWHEYLLNSESSLLKSLTKRLNTLKIISKVASFKTRLMVENGIFCSKLLYCVQCFFGGKSSTKWKTSLSSGTSQVGL